MKKDMGGAAHALALARLVMINRLPVRLHLLIPAVENAISGDAFRPGDILKSRKGLTVEIGNTDAEGRLILADALTKAVEGEPELLLDFATLTGAARIALGPDLPAVFANDDTLAADFLTSGEAVSDPLWRLPLWKHYNEMFASDVADIGNASEAPLAGAVTAALFLQRFVPEGLAWAHLDTFAWRPAAKPGRPKRKASPLVVAPKRDSRENRRRDVSERALKGWMQTLISYVRSGQPDLTNRQMALMLLVYLTPGPHTVRGLANMLGVSKPVITRALNTLGTLGYLRRVRDEADRRNVFVARTNSGQEFLDSFERNIEGDGASRRASKERPLILQHS
jgi:DNA-binding MarR family transcriptional regulator